MFDCVFPTRTARFGQALVRSGQLSLKAKEFANQFVPIDPRCPCSTCRNFTRAALHGLVIRESSICALLTVHNVVFQLELMRDARTAIVEGRCPGGRRRTRNARSSAPTADAFPAFVASFVAEAYPKGDCPAWARDALASVGIRLP